jgi:hypothetical protein
MKVSFAFKAITVLNLFASQLSAQNKANGKQLYLDVHHLGAGKVTLKDAEGAHQKDLSVQKKHGVSFVKYWVDEANGDIYCLAEAKNAQAVRDAHAEAHGLLPDQVNLVTGGHEETIKGKKDLYLDLHIMGPGKVDAAAVAGAHQKDLAVQGKHGLNVINYWVDE